MAKSITDLLILAGERSSDMYGAKIAQEVRMISPNYTIASIGGQELEKEADIFIAESVSFNTVGITELLSNRKQVKNLLSHLDEWLTKNTLKNAMIIDFAHDNFQIACVLKKHGVPITTFITPNFWIWKDLKKAKQLSAYSNTIFSIFKAEHDFYTPLHPHVSFVGHPLASSLLPTPMKPVRALTKTISIFPGSRSHEIRRVFPAALQSMASLPKDTQVWIYFKASEQKSLIKSIIKSHSPIPVNIWEDDMDTLCSITDVAVAGAGTVALELALRNIPAVILGKLNWPSYIIGKYILKIPIKFISLPNILLAKKAIPEFMQFLPPKKITHEIQKLFQPKYRAIIERHYKAIRKQVSSEHPSLTYVSKKIVAL